MNEYKNNGNVLSVPGGATLVTQMRANVVQRDRKKKLEVERRQDFPV